jgi:uncharacterized phiE125 gp8 family phage protein
MMHICVPITKPVRSASPAAFDPISLADAKKQLGIAESNESHDQDVLRMIATARREVEKDAMLVTATGTYTVKRTEWTNSYWLELPSSLRPVTSLTSIVYTATDGTATTWSSAQYSLDTHSITPMVKLVYGYSWPTVRGDINGITITAVAGYANPAAIPADVVHALKLNISMQWQEEMNELKERDNTQKAYERVINLLRQEIYA